ncbi:hypothetical protein GCM10020221_06840 [Streptomyces thioluteus]|uniref:Uncharacterized protein n=1 Tax=Streptomyces thioluteus TaxID=66431 RepID=A0ABN3WGM1_STRTU
MNTVRAQLAAGQQAIAPCREARTGYDEARALWRHPETEDAAALAEAAGHFRDLTELGSELLESLTETIDVMAGLRDKLAELPGKIAPIRERVQASLAAARTELAWAGGSAAQGRYALEARLHAAEDRLRELDAGRVEVTPGRKFTDLYRDVEVQVAEVRDALARASS